MCLIFRYVNGYFGEINGNKYWTLVPTNESKENIKKYEELWIKIRDLSSQLMLYYYRIGISEGIGNDKTSASKESVIFVIFVISVGIS